MIGSARKGGNLVDTAWMHFSSKLPRQNVKGDLAKAALFSEFSVSKVSVKYQETLEAFIMTCTHLWRITGVQDWLFSSLVY